MMINVGHDKANVVGWLHPHKRGSGGVRILGSSLINTLAINLNQNPTKVLINSA